MQLYYKLRDDKSIQPCSIDEWVEQRKFMLFYGGKLIGKDIIDGHLVSTVWVGIDRSHHESNDEPMVFETVIFANHNLDNEIYCKRYSSWKEAVNGHQKAIQWIKNGIKDE